MPAGVALESGAEAAAQIVWRDGGITAEAPSRAAPLDLQHRHPEAPGIGSAAHRGRRLHDDPLGCDHYLLEKEILVVGHDAMSRGTVL